ncbi:MAG: hypothetical protein M3Z24_00825 [Chloroflexota bacterium]|nr:hypothetical protein [Chloroflexota bacterium]
MPFERAVQMLRELTGVQVSEATARRFSYRAGKAVEAVQAGDACSPVPEADEATRQSKQIISVDGAMVSLLKGQWAEVKAVVVGRVEEGKPAEAVHSSHLSYFSRMQDASTFSEQASAELLRRGVDQAHEVCAVMDGAEWIDGFVDWQRADALRILDFAHAAEYVRSIGELAQAAGTILPEDWLPMQLHDLKHLGPAAVLLELRRLRGFHPQMEDIGKKLAYLEKREARMQYPQYQSQGWPIGSGIVESGNKVVMQARLKGAGMHWAPLLAMIAGLKPVSRSPSISSDSRLPSERFANSSTLITSCAAFRFAFSSGEAICHSLSLLPSLSSPLLPTLLGLHVPQLPAPGGDGSSRKSDGHPSLRTVFAYCHFL